MTRWSLLDPDYIPHLRSSSRVIPSYILHFSSASVAVSSTPGSAIHLLVSLTHSCNNPVYTNSLLATLNARKKIRNAGSAVNTPSDVSFSMRDFAKTTSIGSRVRWKTLSYVPKTNCYCSATRQYFDKD